MNSVQTAKPVPPCDQCLHRKVRCDKSLPRCQRCSDANLACSRNVVRRRPGPKKGKGKIISRLRLSSSGAPLAETPILEESHGSPHNHTLSNNGAESTNRQNGLSDTVGTSPDQHDSLQSHNEIEAKLPHTFASPETPATSSRSNELHRTPSPSTYDVSYFVDLFFEKLYPIWPIIDEMPFRQKQQSEPIQRCLLLAMCALTALHVPLPTTSLLEPRKRVSRYFIEQCVQARSRFDYIETASLATIQTSFFLSISEIEFQRTRVSWFLLQEAVMLARELDYYGLAEHGLASQRTLYLLSLTERGLTLLRSKPFSMTVVDSPSNGAFENEDPRILYGLQSLSRLFVYLDEAFLESWINPVNTNDTQAAAKMITIQRNLTSMTFEHEQMTDIQKADILVTQQWMRLVFWQASMRQGLLSSTSEDEALSYHFPCQITRSLCAILDTLTESAIFHHGMAIFERVFEIAYSYIDSVKISSPLISGIDDLKILFRLLRASPNSDSTYTQILETKIEEQSGDAEEILSLIRR